MDTLLATVDQGALPTETCQEMENASARADQARDWHRQMIAEAAYFRAERRGFQGGDPIEDWLAAEVEIDALVLAVQ